MKKKKLSSSLLTVLTFILSAFILIIVLQRVVEWRGRAAGNGTMSLALVGSPAITTETSSFDVQVYVSTGGNEIKSHGVDVVLTFPQNLLELQSIKTDAANSTPLKTFVPLNSITNVFNEGGVMADANLSGILAFGAIPVTKVLPVPPVPTPPFRLGVAPNDAFVGSIQLATLTFKPLAPGQAAINFSHAANNKNDSNISSYDRDASGLTTDLLNTVTNLTLDIKDATIIPTTMPTSTPTSAPSLTPTLTPIPTVTSMPTVAVTLIPTSQFRVFLNESSGTNCISVCSSHGLACVSVGTDNDAVNGGKYSTRCNSQPSSCSEGMNIGTRNCSGHIGMWTNCRCR